MLPYNSFKSLRILLFFIVAIVLLTGLSYCIFIPNIQFNLYFIFITIFITVFIFFILHHTIKYLQKNYTFNFNFHFTKEHSQDNLQFKDYLTENLSKLIFNNTTEAIFICDKNCRLLHANLSMHRFFSDTFSRELALDGEILSDQLFQHENLWSNVLNRLDAGEKVHEFKASFPNEEGRFFWANIRVISDTPSTSHSKRFIVFIQNISQTDKAGDHTTQQGQRYMERLELIIEQRTRELRSRNKLLIKQIEEKVHFERELQKAKKLAEDANSAKSIFLASMSHEIRTPINAMLGMSQMLAESELSETQMHYVRILMTACEGLLALTNNILDFSHYETGQLTLEKRQFQLAGVVDKVIGALLPHAEAKNLTLNSHTDPRLPAIFSGDPTRLHQVLLNILNNAIKFTEQGGVRLEIAALETEAENLDAEDSLLVRFTITDTGIGISPQQRDTIFDSFTQADTSLTRKYGGSGIGLAISKVLVQLMGGTIWFSSEPGKGSEFFFTIRMIPHSPEPTQGISPLWHPREFPSEDNFPSLHVLLVEDSDFNAVVVQSYLKDTHCKIDLATNGEIGFNMFQEHSYDLVLMDIQMPVMDGYTATREMRRWEKEQGRSETPIFAMTAYAMQGDKEKSQKAGCNLHLTKPIKKELLLGAIYAWFSTPNFNARYLPGPLAGDGPETSPVQNPQLEIDVSVDAELFEIAPLFVDTVKNNLFRLEELVQKDDFSAARTIGHQMKGEGKLFGLNPVSRLGLVIQQAAEARDKTKILAAAHELTDYLERVRLLPLPAD